jgi:hypothetical protein
MFAKKLSYSSPDGGAGDGYRVAARRVDRVAACPDAASVLVAPHGWYLPIEASACCGSRIDGTRFLTRWSVQSAPASRPGKTNPRPRLSQHTLLCKMGEIRIRMPAVQDVFGERRDEILGPRLMQEPVPSEFSSDRVLGS